MRTHSVWTGIQERWRLVSRKSKGILPLPDSSRASHLGVLTRPEIYFKLLDPLPWCNACRLHFGDKPVGSGVARQALDIGVNLCLSRPPCSIGRVLRVKAAYASG